MAKGKKRQVWKYYKVENGKLIRLKKECPKCGKGVFMGEHKDRWVCGKCGYTEWKVERKKEYIPQLGIEVEIS